MRAGGISRAIRDGDWELFSWDPQSGRTVWIMEEGGMTHVRTDYPVASLIEENAARRNATPDGWKGDYHHIASVPLNLLHDENTGLHEAFLHGDQKHVSRWLNDSDNAAWRTKEGNV
ncbi:hypothetical protein GCM10007989_07410 [Devosia pacifica]|uniref:Uncharacterized protein n=1 Tax=Devosia pacifica TaxID=1335967 RepID=A0A918VNG3_9HYPH|nr:hypothetical protein [Devosia pacifica]GHA15171.1 hypothetical protein GCM10007989_07410 [Devosia pacifica]